MSTFSRTKKWTMNDQRGLSVCCWDGSCTYWLFYRVKRDASSAWKFSALRDKIIAKFSLRKAFISTWTNISITSSRTGRIINFAPFHFVIHNDFETSVPLCSKMTCTWSNKTTFERLFPFADVIEVRLEADCASVFKNMQPPLSLLRAVYHEMMQRMRVSKPLCYQFV